MNNQNPELQGLVMTAKPSESKYEKKEKKDIAKITTGNHLGRLYGIVDLGEQLNAKFNKRSQRIALLFEFPHLMQDFYERKEGETPELKPTMIKLEETYSMHPKSNFRKLMEAANGGRKFTDDEAKNFNIFGILGNWYTINVMHDPDKKDPNNIYERVNFIQPYDERFKVAGVDYSGINKLMAYSIQLHNFNGPNWQGLWNKFRTQIQSSTEGQAWAAKGGQFEEVKFDENGEINNGGSSASSYQGPSAPPSNAMGGGMQQNTQLSNPASQPMSPPPTAPASAPVKKFVILTPPLDFASWQANNWTEELMIQHGHAHYVDSPV